MFGQAVFSCCSGKYGLWILEKFEISYKTTPRLAWSIHFLFMLRFVYIQRFLVIQIRFVFPWAKTGTSRLKPNVTNDFVKKKVRTVNWNGNYISAVYTGIKKLESFSHSGFSLKVARQLPLNTPKNPNRKTHLRSVIFWNSAEISLVFCQCKRLLQSRRVLFGFLVTWYVTFSGITRPRPAT